MKSLFADLELDFQELKYLINILSTQNDPTLRLMAERRIRHMHDRLDRISTLVNEPSPVSEENNYNLLAEREEDSSNNVSNSVQEFIEKELESVMAEKPEPVSESARQPEQDTELDQRAISVEDIVSTEELIAQSTEEEVSFEIPDIPSVQQITRDEPEPTQNDKKPSPAEKPVSSEPSAQDTPPVKISVREEITITNETIYSEPAILAEQLKPSQSIVQSFSLNDVFRFSGELFDGDRQRMNDFLARVNEMDSWNQVEDYLTAELNTDEENEVMADFSDCLKKFFV